MDVEGLRQRRLPLRPISEATPPDPPVELIEGADSNSDIQQYDNGDVQSLESENAMMVDPPEYVDPQEMDEKDEVAIINPDQLDGETPEKPRADDCKFGNAHRWFIPPQSFALTCAAVAAMKAIIFQPTTEQPPILAEGEHTWHITDWRSLSRREHGPVFEVGGQPW